MEALRSVKVTVNVTQEMAARLDILARRSRWSRSTAAEVLIGRGLDDDDRTLAAVQDEAHDSAA